MKRFLLTSLLALGALAAIDATALAEKPIGLKSPCRRIGRLEGYWLQPTAGPLSEYSSYSAAMYPYFPGAQEYQWQPTTPGTFGTAVAILPAAPPPLPKAKDAKPTEQPAKQPAPTTPPKN